MMGPSKAEDESRRARKYENTNGETKRSESMVDRRAGYQGLKPMAIDRGPLGLVFWMVGVGSQCTKG